MKRLSLPLMTAVGLMGMTALTGCGSGSTDSATSASAAMTPSASSTPSPSSTLSGTVTVLAAASLTESFTALEKSFEAANPGVDVTISFGSSATLAQQIAQGAPADLYASAGTKALDQLPAEAKAKPTTTLAKNVLEIATPPGNPKKVTGLASLADASTNVVLCAETVPCGSAADAVLTKAAVTAHVVSREVDVKATLAKITLGEADAAIVYHSDVVAAGSKVEGVEIPSAQNTTLAYPLVRLTDTAATKAFADLLASAAGLKELEAVGFLAP
jgi:molybdate transport system substrate-binding protein